MRRPFRTPLIEASAEVYLSPDLLVEMRAQSLRERLSPEFSKVVKIPTLLVSHDEQVSPTLFTPAYRFFTEDEQKLVQVGPRMVAYNVTRWEGFDAFKAGARSVIEAFNAVMPAVNVFQFQLSFYNRIPAVDFSEMVERLTIGKMFPNDTLLTDFFCQSSRGIDAENVILTQIQGSFADARTPEPFVAVNNIIRRRKADFPIAVDEFAEWLDAAHERARRNFWDVLTTEAQKSWEENDPN